MYARDDEMDVITNTREHLVSKFYSSLRSSQGGDSNTMRADIFIPRACGYTARRAS